MTTDDPFMPQWQTLGVDPESNRVDLRLVVKKEIEHFKGHFPGCGVLPGVVQIDWVVRLARHHFELPAHGFCGLEQIKFQAVVFPQATLDLRLHWHVERGHLGFVYQDAQRIFSSGRLVWRSTR